MLRKTRVWGYSVVFEVTMEDLWYSLLVRQKD